MNILSLLHPKSWLPKKIGIGFIGLGEHIQRSHLIHLHNSRRCTIIGAVDPTPKAFQGARERHNIDVPEISSIETLLEHPDVDAVVIGTPDDYHLSQLIAVVEARKHVFCEKPLCTKPSELNELERALKSALGKGTTVGTCHPRRYDPPYVWLVNTIAKHRETLGELLEVRMDFSYHKPSENKAGIHGASLLQDHANHEIDFLNHMLGISSFKAHCLHDEYDRYHLAGKREDGVVFNFMGTRRLESTIYPEYMDIRFERGRLHIDTYDKKGSYIDDHEKGTRRKIKPSVTDYARRFKGVNEAWLDAIQGETAWPISIEEMMINTRLSVAFKESSTVSC